MCFARHAQAFLQRRSSRSVIGAPYGIVKIFNTRAGRVASARCSIRGGTRITHSHPPRTQPKYGARCAAIAVRSGGRPEDGRAGSAMSSPAATRLTSPVVVCRRATMMRWRRRWQRRGRQQQLSRRRLRSRPPTRPSRARCSSPNGAAAQRCSAAVGGQRPPARPAEEEEVHTEAATTSDDRRRMGGGPRR